MATEIERKFLITNPAWNEMCTTVKVCNIKQGYLSKGQLSTVRVRIADTTAFVTIKGKRVGNACDEFEYHIPLSDAEEMLALSVTPLVIKTRYIARDQYGQTWDVDVFGGINSGLVLAEIEMETVDQHVMLPEWIGTEVTHDHRYHNTYLAEHSVVVDDKLI